MPRNSSCIQRQNKESSKNIELNAVIEQFLRFCENATCGPEGHVSWPLNSVKKVLNSSSESAFLSKRRKNKPPCKRSRSSCSEADPSSSDCSYDELTSLHSDSSLSIKNISQQSNVEALCPVKMSPPRESRLPKRKLSRLRDSSCNLSIENCPQELLNEKNAEKKSESSVDNSCRIIFPDQPISNYENYDTDGSNSSDIPLKFLQKKHSDENLKNAFDDLDDDDSNSDAESVITVNNEEEEDSGELFRSPRKRPTQKEFETSVLQTPPLTELRRSARFSKNSARKLVFSDQESEEPIPQSPRTPKSAKSCKIIRTPKVNVNSLTPSRGRIETPLRTPTTPRDKAKHALALSAAPESLPCRGKEFKTVYDFVREKISSKESGVLCINGVPGSGKTATIHRVMKKLKAESEKKKLNKFKFVEVNAFDLRKSKEIYRKIYEQLAGDRKTVTIAEQLLTERFVTTKRIASRIPTVLIIDEFDCLLTKKRDVIYKIVEWQAYDNSQLVLLTIANKLDFSDEKKLFSRIKFEKLAFIAYSFKELEEIIKDRLKEFNGFKPEAIQFIARKVAATSGDARKALDICRQLLDTVEAEDENFTFTIQYVSKLLEKIFSNPNIRIIRQLTDLEKIALRAIRDELSRSDKAFCSLWNGVWNQFEAICNIEGFNRVSCNDLLQVCAYLASIGLVKIENDHLDQYSKIWLKCDTDVVKEALN